MLNDNEVLSQKLNIVDHKKKTNSRNFDNECISANLQMTEKEQSNVNCRSFKSKPSEKVKKEIIYIAREN